MNYYGMDGQLLTLEQWKESMEGDFEKTRRVAKTELGSYKVSTVLLGIDHGFRNNERPVIFETMILGPDNDPTGLDEEQWRYCTKEEALTGHEAACALLRERLRERDE